MTMIVSVLVRDGIVLAGDSITTLQETAESTPEKTFPDCQKIFPFYDSFGIGTWGRGSINGKSVYFAVRELENRWKASGVCFNTVDEIAQEVVWDLDDQVWTGENSPARETQDPFGGYVVGYAGQTAKIVEFNSVFDEGVSDVCIEKHSDFGSHVGGITEVADTIQNLYGASGDSKYPPFHMLSLQNAMDYAKFLIRTTEEFQQFSRELPTVGGGIDVAIVTRLDGFRWVQQHQPVTAVLHERY